MKRNTSILFQLRSDLFANLASHLCTVWQIKIAESDRIEQRGHMGLGWWASAGGERSFASLRDVPIAVDIVNVFRAPAALPAIAKEAVAIGARCLWCQFTVINEEGAHIAEEGGLSVIMDRCIKVEHARYAGRMHWLGFNTQRITSVRGNLQ